MIKNICLTIIITFVSFEIFGQVSVVELYESNEYILRNKIKQKSSFVSVDEVNYTLEERNYYDEFGKLILSESHNKSKTNWIQNLTYDLNNVFSSFEILNQSQSSLEIPSKRQYNKANFKTTLLQNPNKSIKKIFAAGLHNNFYQIENDKGLILKIAEYDVNMGFENENHSVEFVYDNTNGNNRMVSKKLIFTDNFITDSVLYNYNYNNNNLLISHKAVYIKTGKLYEEAEYNNGVITKITRTPLNNSLTHAKRKYVSSFEYNQDMLIIGEKEIFTATNIYSNKAETISTFKRYYYEFYSDKVFNDLLIKSNQLFSKGEYDNALKGFRKFISKYKNNSSALLAEALCEAYLNKIDTALSLLDKLIVLHPFFAEASYYSGFIYSTVKKDNTKALAYIKKAYSIEPANSAYADAYAQLLAITGDSKTSVKIYKEVIENGLFTDEILINAGHAFLKEGDRTTACKIWRIPSANNNSMAIQLREKECK
ncbi:MAG: hypothetical protein HJHJAOHD_02644 [Flavobacteriales bacterium]|nr:hypothetical protein [Flavobacteriales bacterium]